MTLEHLEDALLPLVTKPQRYIRPFDACGAGDPARARGRVCLVCPAPFETAFSRPELATLDHSLRTRVSPGVEGELIDWVALPAEDMESILRDHRIGLFGLGARLPLSGYDVLVVHPGAALELPDLLRMLDLGRVPVRRGDRGASDPIVLLVGDLALTPEVAVPFVDAVLPGDPEVYASRILALAGSVRQGLERGEVASRLGFGEEISDPSSGSVVRWGDGLPTAWGSSTTIPLSEIEVSGLPVEVGRPRGPVVAGRALPDPRWERWDHAVAGIEALVASSGVPEVVLSGVAGRHPELDQLVEGLVRRLSPHGVQVRLSEVDPARLHPGLARELRKGRRNRLAFAPVLPSERLRAREGRSLTESRLRESLQVAWRGGWSGLRLTVVLGHPEETEEDRAAWLETVHDLARTRPFEGNAPRLTLSVVPFVDLFADPPVLPDVESVRAIVTAWSRELKRSRVQVTLPDPRHARVEGWLRTGGEAAARLIEQVARAGARGQSDPQSFDPEPWTEALRGGSGPGFVPSPSTSVEIEETGPQPTGFDAPAWGGGRRPRRSGRGRESRYADRYRVRYSKGEALRFLSHLDVTRALERGFRRAQIPVATSQGKDRRLKVAYGPPLPLGMTSTTELFDVTLARELPESFATNVGQGLPEGLSIVSAVPIRRNPASLNSAVNIADYEVSFTDFLIRSQLDGIEFDELMSRLEETVAEALASDRIEFTKSRGDSSRIVNCRPSLVRAQVVRDDGGRPALSLRLMLNRPDSVRPETLTAVLCGWADFDERLLRIHRSGLHIHGRNEVLDPLDVVASGFAWWRQPVRGGMVQ